jgi:hypothetical protein
MPGRAGRFAAKIQGPATNAACLGRITVGRAGQYFAWRRASIYVLNQLPSELYQLPRALARGGETMKISALAEGFG